MEHCPDCQESLKHTPVGNPCPSCGGTRREATVAPDSVALKIDVPSPREIIASQSHDGTSEIVRPNRYHTRSRRQPSGGIHAQYDGRPVQGEEETRLVLKILRQALIDSGIEIPDPFRLPTDREQGFDGVALTNNGDLVKVQVVGVIRTATMKQWGREGRAASLETTTTLADDVLQAIEKKKGRYPSSVRKETILALDACRSFPHVHGEVVALLKTDSSELIRSAGFLQVWLVGPTKDQTWRLDA